MMTPVLFDPTTAVNLKKESLKESLEEKRFKEACKGFEAMFINEMLKAMRKTIPKSGLLDGGLRQEIYESMFDEKVSEALSERGALGIADMLYNAFAPRVINKGEQ
ncbi:Flagellar protein FlgJ [Dissulfuribacter thermophilus]|uniref:Flagellar protein FlgJ n=1 Tax=Dissulfuribacter thermophilus TaxID=1156395 RepID=A0A1B9F6L6_9BACT|nr:rod-binding protein [Dissulfuribacter thermophilus]OCC15556.1 Flagellar protein FlgJ [Dissulfuribacter thermophilus]